MRFIVFPGVQSETSLDIGGFLFAHFVLGAMGKHMSIKTYKHIIYLFKIKLLNL